MLKIFLIALITMFTLQDPREICYDYREECEDNGLRSIFNNSENQVLCIGCDAGDCDDVNTYLTGCVDCDLINSFYGICNLCNP